MMIERGIAYINNNGGFIDAEQPPTPVRFHPASFRLVHDGDRVAFKRSSTDPEWAVSVAPEHRVAAMVGSIGKAKFTQRAEVRLAESSVQLLTEAQAAPTEAQTERHLQASSEKLRKLLKVEAPGTGKLDVRTIGRILKKIQE